MQYFNNESKESILKFVLTLCFKPTFLNVKKTFPIVQQRRKFNTTFLIDIIKDFSL